MWIPKPFHKFLQENQRSLTIAALGNKGFQHFSFMVNGTPQIMRFTVNPYEDLIEMPFPVRIIVRRRDPFLSDFARKQWAKSVPPIANRFMTDVDTPFMKKVFDVAKRKGKSDIHHHG